MKPATIGNEHGMTGTIPSKTVLVLASGITDPQSHEEYLFGVLAESLHDERPFKRSLEEWARETGHTLRIKGPMLNVEVEP